MSNHNIQLTRASRNSLPILFKITGSLDQTIAFDSWLQANQLLGITTNIAWSEDAQYVGVVTLSVVSETQTQKALLNLLAWRCAVVQKIYVLA